MNTLKIFIISTGLMALSLSGFSQHTYYGLPAELKDHTIVFLEYEMLPVRPHMNKMIRKMYEKRNKSAVEANQQLREAVKAYPFPYVISTRAEYKSWAEKGYRYVYENDLMEKYNNGANVYAGQQKRYVSDMYVQDLQTKDKYVAFELSQTFVYYYKGIMRKLMKQVKKKFPEAVEQ